MKDPKRTYDIDYLKILSRKMQGVPAWRDMALACNSVIGQEVDARRRRLEKIRDSVKYRRGDVINNFIYNPETNKLAINELTREAIDIPFGYFVKKGIIKNVVRNLALYTQPNGTDYLDVSFDYNGTACRWLLPTNITQERDALLKNSYIMGFDFFNTKLSDEDLQRLYETVQIYWNESGSDDNFMKFIGFIKNIRFDLVALWSEDTPEHPADDPNNEYPFLEPFDNTMKSITDGGTNWQTSHVELDFDLAQFREFYKLNLDDLEQLFYYFAPIILVLERIVGKLTVETEVDGINAVTLDRFEHDFLQPGKVTEIDILGITAYLNTNFKYNKINTEREGCLGLDGRVNLTQTCFDFQPYLASAGII